MCKHKSNGAFKERSAGAVGMAQWVKVTATKPDDRKRELIPKKCPLTSTNTLSHTYTHRGEGKYMYQNIENESAGGQPIKYRGCDGTHL